MVSIEIWFLEQKHTNFSFDNGTTTANDIFVINVARSRYKESLLPGSFNLTLVVVEVMLLN
jgi:hypothetical protein